MTSVCVGKVVRLKLPLFLAPATIVIQCIVIQCVSHIVQLWNMDFVRRVVMKRIVQGEKGKKR